MITAKRLTQTPILSPDGGHPWEAAAVFNAAAVCEGGRFHLIYRASDIAPISKAGRYINSLGYAQSTDGIHFDRMDTPIMTNDVPSENRGPEDPRIVKIDGIFQMLYTGYSDTAIRICRATSTDLVHWERHGVVLDETNKDASLFPEKIRGKYVMFHRREPDIWIAYSDDLKTWYDHQSIMAPIPSSSWENRKVGISGPPIKTDAGWLLIYHGTSDRYGYCQGIALLDLENPGKVLWRQSEPIMMPELEWERNGYVNNVIFSCGQVELDDRILIYYAGADTAIGVAEILKKDLPL